MYRFILISLISLLLIGCDQQSKQSIEVNGKIYVSGSDYSVLAEPIQLDDSMVANFIEIFWYGCRHCEKFEPLLQDWIKQLPAGSRFSRSPAIWSEPMMVHARAYYVANSLQLGHQFHMKLFTRILGLRASSDLAYHRRSIGQLFKVNGVGEAQFNELYDSDQVSKQVRFSRGLMKAAVINSTPSFLINGKYVLTATGFKSRQEMLALAKALLVSEMNSQPSDWW